MYCAQHSTLGSLCAMSRTRVQRQKWGGGERGRGIRAQKEATALRTGVAHTHNGKAKGGNTAYSAQTDRQGENNGAHQREPR